MALSAMAVLSACNKEPDEIPMPAPQPISGTTIGAGISSRSEDSLFMRIVERGGLLDSLKNSGKSYTVWIPDSNAIKQFLIAAAGGALPANASSAMVSGFIRTALPAANANAIASYHIAPGTVRYASLSSNFPNVQYPTLFNPAPTVSSLLRMTIFPSPRNFNYLNNIPVTLADQSSSNGTWHKIAAVNVPPSQFLWDRINTDTSMSYFKAAIQRADSGTTGTLQSALANIGANLTVFVPSNAAFKALLYAQTYPAVYGSIYQQAIAGGATPAQATAAATAQAPTATTNLVGTPAVFSNPALYSSLTATTVKGIAVYHVMGVRAFTNNFPTTRTNYPTLLNVALAAHPGVGLSVTFTPSNAPMVSAASVKGAANATASNIAINPFPGGSSDQNYLNGVIHKLDQVLLPQ